MLHELDEGQVTGNISLEFLLQLHNFTQCYCVKGQAVLFAVADLVQQGCVASVLTKATRTQHQIRQL